LSRPPRTVDSPRKPERIAIAEASAILGRPIRTVSDMAARGLLPTAAKIGSRWTFVEAALRQYVKDEEEATARRAMRNGMAVRRADVAARPPRTARFAELETRYERAMRTAAERVRRAPS
jgi:hypothetical protein